MIMIDMTPVVLELTVKWKVGDYINNYNTK